MFGRVETANGYVMVAIASEKTFQRLIEVIGHPEWIADPRFALYADRRDNWAELMNGVETWSRTLTTEKCLAQLNGHGVPCSAYRTVAEALRDPQIAHRKCKVQPKLALSCEPSEDFTIWTFRLRPGVKLPDGTHFNAEAAKVNFER